MIVFCWRSELPQLMSSPFPRPCSFRFAVAPLVLRHCDDRSHSFGPAIVLLLSSRPPSAFRSFSCPSVPAFHGRPEPTFPRFRPPVRHKWLQPFRCLPLLCIPTFPHSFSLEEKNTLQNMGASRDFPSSPFLPPPLPFFFRVSSAFLFLRGVFSDNRNRTVSSFPAFHASLSPSLFFSGYSFPGEHASPFGLTLRERTWNFLPWSTRQASCRGQSEFSTTPLLFQLRYFFERRANNEERNPKQPPISVGLFSETSDPPAPRSQPYTDLSRTVVRSSGWLKSTCLISGPSSPWS